mgnify:CR=1 FL=1
MAKNKKKKIPWQGALMLLVFLALGGVCGVMIARCMDALVPPDASPGGSLILFAGMILVFYLLLVLQIVIHEGGHLIFGLLSGYQFSSFRVASFMWVRQEGTLRFKRLSLAGTGGQCLMDPPDMVDGKLPVALYNLGGSILNLLSALLCLGLFFLTRDLAFWPAVFLMSALIGLVYALVNGIPLRLGAVDNDGHNALSLGKDPAALRAFWIQMKMAAMQAQGVRLKDMPVTQDESLRRRLNALVTTGDESGTADALEKTLKDLKNRCRFNKKGLLPELETTRDALEQKLQQLQALKHQIESITQRQTALDEQIRMLSNHRQALEYQEHLQSQAGH